MSVNAAIAFSASAHASSSVCAAAAAALPLPLSLLLLVLRLWVMAYREQNLLPVSDLAARARARCCQTICSSPMPNFLSELAIFGCLLCALWLAWH